MTIHQERKMQREESILLSLKKLDYLSRRQIQRLHDLGGDRNARRVMANIKGFVESFRSEKGETVFYLSRSGRERVGCEVVRQSKTQANHYLMRNDLYIHYRPEDWKSELRLSIQDVVTVIPDAYFRYDMRRHFLEVDHLQHMNKNREKIERYRKLKDTGTLQEKLKYFPRLVWVTVTEGRRQQLIDWCEGLDVKVHLWNEIQ